MHQIRKILSFHAEGVSIRRVAHLLGISRNTVRDYLRRAQSSGLSLADLSALSDEVLSSHVFSDPSPVPPADARWVDLERRLPGLSRELRRKGVTKQLLWEEYRREQPEGYSYTQFCTHFRQFLGKSEAVMYLQHTPGEVLQVDFAGDKMHWVDPSTGEAHACEVLVCTLPFSAMTYVEALPSQRQADFLQGIARALAYFGGVSRSIRCDNLRAAVVRASRYEPIFTEAAALFAAHYDTVMTATRVAKPRDKASVENAVNKTYQRIYAPLRNDEFHSLQALNAAIHRQLKRHNTLPFKGKNYSRLELFEQEERPRLLPLPHRPYVQQHVVWAKVQRNYHVILGEDRHQYSVPFAFIGKTLQLIYDPETVEIYDSMQRVAVHRRDRRAHTYTTLADHMPPNHQHIHERKGWTPDFFEKKAQQIGTATLAVVQRILESKTFLEQTYNTCLGILRLADRYGAQRLEAASQRALCAPRVNYSLLENILRRHLDQAPQTPPTPPPLTLFTHENLRLPSDFS